MSTKELIGKTVIDIYCLFETTSEHGFELDLAQCFIEVDEHTTIGYPYFLGDENLESDVPNGAGSIFAGLLFEKVYHVNSKGWPISELDYGNRQGVKKSLYWLKNLFVYRPYKTVLVENKVMRIKGHKIADILCFNIEDDELYFELDNGSLFTLIRASPSGTGITGVKYFNSSSEIPNPDQMEFIRLSQYEPAN